MFKTVLVIDTDTETTRSIVHTLESEDYLVFTAPSEDVGISMAIKVNPGVIFVNPAIAGVRRFEICKTIRSIEQLKNVPIIVLSASEEAIDPSDISLYGIVDSLKKTFSPEDLISKTRDALSTKSVDIQLGNESQRPDVSEVREGGEELISHDEPVASFASDDSFSPENPPGSGLKREETIEEREGSYVLKKNIRRQGRKNVLLAPVIGIVIIIILIFIGIELYKKGSLSGTKIQKLEVKTINPPQQQASQVTSPPETQRPKQSTGESKPLPESKAAAAPAALLKPEPRPARKTMYSVQIGAFKNENNAKALAKEYKEKGYKAFTFTTAPKDKETLYRVLIGRFKDKKEAINLARSIRVEEEIETIIFKD